MLKIDDATIKITGFEVVPPSADYGDEKPSLIITYDFTNNSNELLQPVSVWITHFNATQETETTVDSLVNSFMLFDEKYQSAYDISQTDVKAGATVQAIAIYGINDVTKPITLKATQGLSGDDLGEKIINLQ